MDEKLSATFSLLRASLQGDMKGWICLSTTVHRFMEDLLLTMNSPVAAPYAVKFYLDLASVLSESCDAGFKSICKCLSKLYLK